MCAQFASVCEVDQTVDGNQELWNCSNCSPKASILEPAGRAKRRESRLRQYEDS